MSENKDKIIQYIEDFLSKDYVSLEDNLKKLLSDYKRKTKRLDKIMKLSDRQQLSLLDLNTHVTQQKEELDKLYTYDKEQQLIAKEKLDETLTNDLINCETLKSNIIYHSSDILSGDFYSLHYLSNGAAFIYVIDGQGHGISPALTVFAVSSAITHLLEEDLVFEEIVDRLFPMIQKVLGEIEQLSYTILYIDKNKKDMSYLSGGMYPFIIKQGDEVSTFKVNNLPFMNFSPTPTIKSITLENWSDIIIYTDGLVEDLGEDMSEFSPLKLLANSKVFEDAKQEIKQGKFDDDITVVRITKI